MGMLMLNEVFSETIYIHKNDLKNKASKTQMDLCEQNIPLLNGSTI